MPGDYSRKIFNRKKHYSAVLEQQGRVQLDADWNEQVDLQHYREQTASLDLVGKSGIPKNNGGFKVSINPNKTDLYIAPGRIYISGLLFECEADPAASYLSQPHYTEPDRTMFADDEIANLIDGSYIAFIEAWQREISYLDDPQIQEVALGEADTTTRLQNIWQFKLLRTAIEGTINCKTDFPEWNNIIAAPTGKLNVQTTEDAESSKPCVLPAKGGYSSLENQLYRVQIIRGGDQSAATYAWSRDNASIETAILNISGSTLTVSDIGKDEILGFSGGHWVEIVESEPSSAPPILFEINSVKPELKQIELQTSANIFQGKTNLKLRRWDMSGADYQNGIPVSTAWENMENGIQLMFAPGTYRAGDYWLIPARSATADIEWPRDNAENNLPQLPKGIEKYFSRLALVKVADGNVSIDDCRALFPTLTEICAEDICYSNKGCGESTATNVQEALDELCHKRDGACTYIAFPGVGWEKVFDKIAPGKDAQVCFQVGDYPLTSSVIIKDKGHLKLNGAGTGTRIIASGAEAAFVFEQCKSIVIRDIYAATSSFISKPAKNTKHLNGVITAIDCPSVKFSDLYLQCGTSTKAQVTCITVRNKAALFSSVHIQDCDLSIGNYQQGILLVNVVKSIIQNNRLTTHGSVNSIRREGLLSDKKYLSTVRSTLISKAGVKDLKDAEGMSVVNLTSSGQRISFLTTSSLKNDWSRLLAQNPANNIFSSKDLLNHVKKLADKVMLDKNFAETIDSFRAIRRAIIVQAQSIASRGITIAGTMAQDTKILNNTIENVLVGVHIGLSHQSARNIHDSAVVVMIHGNNIQVLLPRDAGKLDRHGIFIGNCRNCAVEDNNLFIQRLSGAQQLSVEGIKVWGLLGDRLIINKNVVCAKDGIKNNSFSTGILVKPIVKKSTLQQWLVMFNVAISRSTAIVISNGVVSTNNTP